jgi:hypothetical protein
MDWDLVDMLHAMSWTAKGVVIMLLVMSAISIGLMLERGLRYSVARNQSRMFIQLVTRCSRKESSTKLFPLRRGTEKVRSPAS